MTMIFEESITCEFNHTHRVWLHSGGAVYAHENENMFSLYGTEDGSEVSARRFFLDMIIGGFAKSYEAKRKRAIANCHRMMNNRDKMIASTPKG